MLGQGNQSPHQGFTRISDKHRAVSILIIWISNIHADSASEDLLSTGLDSMRSFNSFSFSNEFYVRIVIGSKSLERRFIGSGYDASLSLINKGLDILGHHLRFLIW